VQAAPQELVRRGGELLGQVQDGVENLLAPFRVDEVGHRLIEVSTNLRTTSITVFCLSPTDSSTSSDSSVARSASVLFSVLSVMIALPGLMRTESLNGSAIRMRSGPGAL
jgi:hypothetical protein